jgi:hypothetical protein
MVDKDTAGSTYTTYINIYVYLITSFPPDSDPVHNQVFLQGKIILVKRNLVFSLLFQYEVVMITFHYYVKCSNCVHE